MKAKLFVPLFLILCTFPSFAQFYKVLESDNNHIKIKLNFDKRFTLKEKNVGVSKINYIQGGYSFHKRGEPWLPSEDLKIGIPASSEPVVTIGGLKQEKNQNIFLMPSPDSLNEPYEKLYYNTSVYSNNVLFPQLIVNSKTYVMRFLRVASLEISPYQYNPVTRELIFNKEFIININYNSPQNKNGNFIPISDQISEEFSESMLNPKEAKSFLSKEIKIEPDRVTTDDSLWYNPSKDFYKIYLKEKGLYRVTYEQLVNSGVPENNGLHNGKLELFNMGKRIPLEILDNNNNGLFDGGDYFQFIGSPPPPADSFTYFNIYNTSNVYWFSYEADSVLKYKSIDGSPVDFSQPQIYSTLETIHYEKDTVRENLGYAPDDRRDFWLWESAEARAFHEYKIFTYWMEDQDTIVAYNINPSLTQVTLKAGLQGITNTNCNGNGHSAQLKFNTNIVATKKWDGQNSVVMEANFPVDINFTGGIPLYKRNKLEVALDGDVCESQGSDLVRVNWLEFSYWRNNKILGGIYNFKNPPNRIGKNLYYLYRWYSDSIKIYIPQRGEYILNARINHDSDQSVQFQDSIGGMTDYFCYGNGIYLSPDSIVKDKSSDLRNISQGVDYLIITHPLFTSVAQRLANYRSNHLKGYDNPRIKIVDIFDIYDEFSYGLLNPSAVQKFIKYVFDKWQSPTIGYVTLLGDMSYDYRHIYNGKLNYIPSMAYQAIDYGQAPSDNLFVAVSGDDIIPDIAIGRLSCETVEEGNILVDKIINYPADNGKEWKQNVLLMASGMDALDELTFGFNDQSESLDAQFLEPNGIHASKVYRFPNKPEYNQYQGGGPEIREQFNKGAVLANYYGHGGGGQWDLTFTNDDIYQLNNQNRLPVVISVTCYTAHFDDQTIFGEIFNRVPGKGSVAFYGSSGLTWWQAGTYLNNLLFDQIFNQKNYTIGKAILNSKANSTGNTYYLSQVALLHLLGDPALELALPQKPDFAINSSDITYKPSNPLKGDTVNFQVKIKNVGINFSDSVTVALYHTKVDTSTLIGLRKINHFGEIDSTDFRWIVPSAGLYKLICVVNGDDVVPEDDHSDNEAFSQIVAFDFSEPNIVKPLNGATFNNKVNFALVDVGDYIGRKFKYQIEIDTSRNLDSPIKILSPILEAQNGVVKWTPQNLSPNEYYWKAIIFDAIDTNYSKVSTFSISTEASGSGYSIKNKQLKFLENYNMYYNDSNKSLQMNLELLSPRPNENQLLDTMKIVSSDSTHITSFTTDGSYFYFLHLPFYKNWQPSKIYRVGTGLHGTIRGKIEAALPNAIDCRSSIFYYSDGYIYSSNTSNNSLIKINKSTGDTTSITLGDTLLPSLDGLLKDKSGYYLCTDGNLVYNLSAGCGNYRNKYVLRIFDPKNSWQKVGKDLVFSGNSAYGFSGFCIVNGKLYTYESYDLGYIRRYDIATYTFEEEWMISKALFLYTLSYDWINNNVTAALFKPGSSLAPAFYRFKGTYKDARASVNSDDIGPAYKWTNIKYDIDSLNYAGEFNVNLLGLNKGSGIWDTLKQHISPVTQLDNLNPKIYEYLKMNLNFMDSSYGVTEAIKLKKISAEFQSLPEISLHKNDIIFKPDTLMQGFSTELSVKVQNLGDSDADSVLLKYVSNDSDSAFITNKVNVPHDSSITVKNVINTSSWAPATLYNTKVIAEVPFDEQYTFNNISQQNFFVSRDSINPEFKITFDGKEINNGDIVSAKPKIVISLKDNSPLPLDTTMFTLVFNNIPMSFSRPDIKIENTAYPNNEIRINWDPTKLIDGKNVLEVLAKDASGNFFDTVTHKIEFYVYNETDLKNVFNFPNPFKNDTYFTFELLGQSAPQEFTIKIFTVAGRLIREISVPSDNLKVGFNRVYWDGKDQDADEVANGLYFYKIISKNNGVIKTAIQKLAKLK